MPQDTREEVECTAAPCLMGWVGIHIQPGQTNQKHPTFPKMEHFQDPGGTKLSFQTLLAPTCLGRRPAQWQRPLLHPKGLWLNPWHLRKHSWPLESPYPGLGMKHQARWTNGLVWPKATHGLTNTDRASSPKHLDGKAQVRKKSSNYINTNT